VQTALATNQTLAQLLAVPEQDDWTYPVQRDTSGSDETTKTDGEDGGSDSQQTESRRLEEGDEDQ
jgi:hypothetical protein